MSEGDDLEEVKRQIEELKQGGNSVQDLPKYISALHHLNEMKDSAEIILGKLAEVKGITVQAVHDEFELDTKLKTLTAAPPRDDSP